MDVPVADKKRDKIKNHSLTINAIEDTVSGTLFMPWFTEQDNTVMDTPHPGEAVLDSLKVSAVPLIYLYLLGQKVWL